MEKLHDENSELFLFRGRGLHKNHYGVRKGIGFHPKSNAPAKVINLRL